MGLSKFYAIKLDDMVVVSSIESVLTRICNARNIPYTEAIKFMFLEGLKALSSKQEFEVNDQDMKLSVAINSQLEKIMLSKAQEQNLIKLLDFLGEEDFIKWCAENGINSDPIISNSETIKRRLAAEETRTLAMWLDRMLSDMLPHRYEDIIKEAVVSGKIPDAVLYPEAYRSKVKTLSNIASTNNYSSRDRRGYWQKKMD